MNRSITCGETSPIRELASGCKPERFKNPLCHGLAQGVCFAVLFQPECNFTPR